MSEILERRMDEFERSHVALKESVDTINGGIATFTNMVKHQNDESIASAERFATIEGMMKQQQERSEKHSKHRVELSQKVDAHIDESRIFMAEFGGKIDRFIDTYSIDGRTKEVTLRNDNHHEFAAFITRLLGYKKTILFMMALAAGSGATVGTDTGKQFLIKVLQ